ncbi:MAG: 5'-3' exonuclease H3TH domain-containing protein [Endozoicomonas sp.]
MPARLLLIDALNLIRRVHAAVKAPDDNSQVDGAISATVSSLSRALKHASPTHALVVFDGNPPTWRHELFPDYKSQRKPMPEALQKRLGDFNSAFIRLGIKSFRRSGLEADDVIAAIASKAVQAEIEVTILSTDRSFQQLLTSPCIKLRDHFKKVDYDQQSVRSQTGFEPDQLVDYWAMAGFGDVPGVNGVGGKGATQLLSDFGSLDAVLGQSEEAKGPAAKVVSQKEQAELSRRLARLACDLELGLSLKDLRYQPVASAE